MFKGIRILDTELTDALKAKGLGYRPDHVDIYSNSWGPGDTGSEVAEAGVMTEEVLKQGALKVSLLWTWGLFTIYLGIRSVRSLCKWLANSEVVNFVPESCLPLVKTSSIYPKTWL